MKRIWLGFVVLSFAACDSGGGKKANQQFTQSVQFTGNVAAVTGPMPTGMPGVASVTPPGPKTVTPGQSVTFDVAWVADGGKPITAANVGFGADQYFTTPIAGAETRTSLVATVQSNVCDGLASTCHRFKYFVQVLAEGSLAAEPMSADVVLVCGEGSGCGLIAQPADGGATGSVPTGSFTLQSCTCDGLPKDLGGAAVVFDLRIPSGSFVTTLPEPPCTLTQPFTATSPQAGTLVLTYGRSPIACSPASCSTGCGMTFDWVRTLTYQNGLGTLTTTEDPTPPDEYGCASKRQVCTFAQMN